MTDEADAARWERIKSVFADALELEGDARRALLARASTDDPALGIEVASLLEAHERGGPLMASPTLGADDWARPPRSRAASPSGRTALPDRLARYHIRSLLGTGGMGEVYLAHDPLLARDVALKVLPADLAEHPHRRARFLQEARSAASLNHPNITTIHEIGEAEGRDFIAFEYVEGRTLRDRIAGRPMELKELVDVAVPLADALAHAHERGLVHRDVKSANVMVSARGVPKLLDFGLAKLVHAREPDPASEGSDAGSPSPTDAPRTVRGTITGTPEAMSPEQALGHSVDQRTDVFSFGSLLHEMATGRAAFSGRGPQATLQAVIHEEPASLRELRPDLPGEFLAIVDRALRKRPEERYQDLATLAADLRQLQRATDTGLFAAPAGALVPRRAARKGLALVTGAALLALVALTAWLVSKQGWLGGLDGHPAAARPPSEEQAQAADPAAAMPRSRTPSAVMCFENTTDVADSGQLGDMLSRLLTTHLASGSDIPMVSRQRLYEVARDLGRPDGRVDRSTATAVAQRAGVGTMILGQVSRTGESLVATAEIVDAATGRTLGSVQSRGIDAADIFSMAASLGRQVRDTLREPAMSEVEKGALDEQLTTSVEAFRAFSRGLEALQRNHPDDAAEALRQATALDPAFALAHYRLAMALVWTGRFDEITSAIERATAFSERLPPAIRLVLAGARPYFMGDDTRSALPLLLAALATDPDNPDALYMLGEIYTHSATRNDARKAQEMYERLLDLDRGISLVYEHLLSACLCTGHVDTARRLLAAWKELEPDNLAELEGTFALWEGRMSDAAALLREPLPPDMLVELPDIREEPASVQSVLALDVPGIVESLKNVSGLYRVMALDLRADLLATHGRFTDAAQLYRLASDVSGAWSSDGFLTNARAGARHRLAFLLALQGDLAGARREAAATLELQPDSFRCLYVTACLALRDGDEAAAEHALATLTDLATRDWSPSASLYREALAAELLLARGAAVDARARFAALVDSGRLMEDWYAYEDSLGPAVRDGLARACLASGDPAGAAQAWAGLLESGLERLRAPLLWVPALAARGQLLLAAGDEAGGRALLQRFAHCWGSDAADESVASLPQVMQARDLLAAPARR